MPPVVHHVELCVKDGSSTMLSLAKFGFYLHARRTTPLCQQWVVKVGGAVFMVTQRRPSWMPSALDRTREEPWTVLCCEDKKDHEIDTVFNVAFRVKNVQGATKRIESHGGIVIQPPTQIRDEFGQVTYSIVRSCCGNVAHTLINKDDYRGMFLPGFENARLSGDCDELDEWDRCITHVDHVTLACHPGNSQSVITWYENCFGMQRFSISSNDNDDEGLVLEDGVGLRLKAMEYWKCAETGLSYQYSAKDRQLNRNGVMLVVVESLPGQINCNVETFLKEHEGPGIEHIALSTSSMLHTVSKMAARGVNFRQPPSAYYNEIKKIHQINGIGEDLEALRPLGILLDSEVDPQDMNTQKPKYLMQIFAHPMFSKKTFFIEVIQRCGARGLGAGNILALVRSVREEEAKKQKQKASRGEEHSQASGTKIVNEEHEKV